LPFELSLRHSAYHYSETSGKGNLKNRKLSSPVIPGAAENRIGIGEIYVTC
jgi:hypothetical protein